MIDLSTYLSSVSTGVGCFFIKIPIPTLVKLFIRYKEEKRDRGKDTNKERDGII